MARIDLFRQDSIPFLAKVVIGPKETTSRDSEKILKAMIFHTHTHLGHRVRR
jgi:hypothetical protein